MIHNSKVYVKKSTIHGWGVFAKEDIKQGDIVEECLTLTLPIIRGQSSPLMIDYRFNWPQGSDWKEQVLALGYGSLYNHSETPNAYWVSNIENKSFLFISNRDIKQDEEILVWYGDVNYWNDGRNKVQIV